MIDMYYKLAAMMYLKAHVPYPKLIRKHLHFPGKVESKVTQTCKWNW